MKTTLKYQHEFKGFNPWLCKLFIGNTCIAIGNFEDVESALKWADSWRRCA